MELDKSHLVYDKLRQCTVETKVLETQHGFGSIHAHVTVMYFRM